MLRKALISLMTFSLCLHAGKPVAKPQVTPKKEKPASTIVIKNNITPPMLKYWSYSPTDFCVKVNNETIEPGTTKTIKRDGDKVKVTYHCSFRSGAYKSAKEVEFELKPDVKEANLTFSWDEKQRVVLSDAKIKHVKELK